MYEEGDTHLLTLQRRVVFTLVFLADDAQLGEVAQFWVYGEFAELIASPGQEVCGMCTGSDPIRYHGMLACASQTRKCKAHWKMSKSSNVSTWIGLVALFGLSSPIPSSPLTAF